MLNDVKLKKKNMIVSFMKPVHKKKITVTFDLLL